MSSNQNPLEFEIESESIFNDYKIMNNFLIKIEDKKIIYK